MTAGPRRAAAPPSPWADRAEAVALVLLFSAGFLEAEIAHVGPLTLTSTKAVLAAFFAVVFLPRVRRPRSIRTGGAIAAALLALAASGALSAALCDHYRVLAWKYTARGVSWVVLYVALANALATPARRRLAFRTLGVTAAAVTLLAIVEHFRYDWVAALVAPFRSNIFVGAPPPAFFSSGVIQEGDELFIRSSAVFLHANMLGYFLAIAMFLIVAELPARASRPAWTAIAAALALFGYALTLTFSRGAFLAFAVPGFAMGAYLTARNPAFRDALWNRHRQALLVAVAIALVAVLTNRVFLEGIGSLLPRAFTQAFVARVTGKKLSPLAVLPLDARQNSYSSRKALWKAALRMARARPLVGIGPDNFRMRFAEYVDALDQDLSTNLGIHRAHNVFLNVLAEQGLIGLAALLLLGLALLREARRGFARAGVTVETLAFSAALAAILIGNLFDTVFYYNAYMILLMAAFASWNAVARGAEG